MAAKPIEPCPVTPSRVRQLRAVAVLANDDRGPTRYAGDGPQKIADAAAGHVPAGPCSWSYETRNGSIVPWPNFAKVTPEPGQDAVWPQVERMAELIARVHRDAYRQVNELMAETITAQSSVMATLANRTVYLEERLAAVELTTGAPAGVDSLAEKVIDAAMKANQPAARPPKAKPNGNPQA
jgi:hypothetical protein